jgi:hypothetical protein
MMVVLLACGRPPRNRASSCATPVDSGARGDPGGGSGAGVAGELTRGKNAMPSSPI